MSLIGFTDLGRGIKAASVDHDPTAVATDAPSGSLIIDANGALYLKLDAGASTNVRRIGLHEHHIGIQGSEFPYFEIADATYAVAARMAFRGSDAVGVPIAVSFILYNGESGGSHYARLYDVTNVQVIAEVGPFSGETPAVQIDSALANIPPAAAVLEAQVRDANGKKVRISGTALIF